MGRNIRMKRYGLSPSAFLGDRELSGIRIRPLIILFCKDSTSSSTFAAGYFMFIKSQIKRPLSILFLVLLSACTLQSEPEPRTPSLTLNASVREGVAPLEVTFSTTVSPEASRYAWTLAGQALDDTTAELTHTFDAPGVYLVTVTATTSLGPVSESTTVKVTQAAPSEPPSEPIGDTKLEVTRTPAGPAPWAVRYSVQAEGYGSDAQFRVHCSAEGDASYEEEGGAVCLHTTAGEQVQIDILMSDEVVDSVQVNSEVTPPQQEVAFLGTWRYSSRGKSETFEIARGTAVAGEDQTSAFKLFVIKVGRSRYRRVHLWRADRGTAPYARSGGTAGLFC